ncbi:MAG TPA: 1-deoxy-D-xylulose-5-phosphate reductoisomerase [Actinomycetota bacterium]|nr:1-deoxy-D-xylulose-5-phosphate reductoisomerase [Actinomycetota bacterium]
MTSPRRIVILGSTGSIGRQALEVVRSDPQSFVVVGLAAGSDAAALDHQADEFDVKQRALGEEEAVELASLDEADVVLNAIVGAAGLRASVAALEAGKLLALANKESLVAGGVVCKSAAERGGGQIVAVDSEHAALAQCLDKRRPSEVARIVITASGGPFRTRTDLEGVTPEEALRHPTWSMGPKITIDSATLMNKGLEVIEAHFLFGFEYDRIDVCVHPQSVVHGMVEFVDGSLLMQAAPTDMAIPIQAALTYPDRKPGPVERIDPAKFGELTFEPVDTARFPALELARSAGRSGRSFPAVLNASNEVAVGAFLDERLPFTAITGVTEKVLDKHVPTEADSVEDVMAADGWARSEAEAEVGRR